MDIDLLIFSSDAVSSENGSEAFDAQIEASEEALSEEKASEQDKAEEEFEELIRGKYKDAFNKRTKGIIDRRLKNVRSAENTLKEIEPLLTRLSEMFPDIAGSDTAGLVKSFLESEKKMPKEEKTEPSPLLIRAESILKERAAQRLSQRLSEEEKKLREIYPAFDLHSEYTSSPEFRRLLHSGVDVRRAFETVNLERIMGSALKYAVMKAGKSTADAMLTSKRASESSLKGQASSVTRTDVKSLTEREIMSIISAVGRGEKISF